MWAVLLLKGILVGLCASIPLGPIGVICVQRTVNKGRRSGFASGYGAALADTIFASIAVFGLSYVIDFIRSHEPLIQILGGTGIAILGLFIFLRDPLKRVRRDRRAPSTPVQDATWIFLLTLTNPLAIFLFLGLLAAVRIELDPTHLGSLLSVLLGVHLGATSWWYVLTLVVARFRHRFHLRQLFWFNKIAGLAILILGGIAAAIGLIHLIL